MKNKDAGIAAVVFCVLAALYWRFHCPTFGPGDSPQHVLSALTWGTGYSSSDEITSDSALQQAHERDVGRMLHSWR